MPNSEHNYGTSQRNVKEDYEALDLVFEACISEFNRVRAMASRSERRGMDAVYRKGRSKLDAEGPAIDSRIKLRREGLCKAAIIHPEFFRDGRFIYNGEDVG